MDPGSRSTGYGVVESGPGGVLVHVASGSVAAVSGAAEPGGGLPARLFSIWGSLGVVMDEHRPDAVSVEGLFYGMNVRSALVLGHARGVVLLCAAQRGLPVFEYSPSVVKQSVVGYGGASKRQVQKMVTRLLGCAEKRGADAADALAVAICHIHHAGTERRRRAASPAVRG